MKDLRAEIVRSGTWLYRGSEPLEIWVVKQNFEHDFEEEYDEVERLNQNGEVFKLLYAKAGVLMSAGTEYFSADEAIHGAEATIKVPITWDDHILQPLYGGRSYRLVSETEL